MSCDDITGSEVLVYVRRTNGGGVNGVIYSWDYYQMASLPTNDNVRYQKPKDNKNPSVPLHEIGNNRYEDMVCKSTHIAYKIGGFSRSAPIPIDEAKNEVDKRIETTDNRCVLLMVSSSSFYQRLPECWPWSCRRWTIDISGKVEKDGTKKKIYSIYKQDINGDWEAVPGITTTNPSDNADEELTRIKNYMIANKLVPIFTAELSVESEGGQINKTYQEPVFKIGSDTYGSDITGSSGNGKIDTMPTVSAPDSIAMNGSFYEEVEFAKATENNPGDPKTISDREAADSGCDKSSQKVMVALEVFPVLCNGVCKLVIKTGYKCVDKDNKSKGGNSVKKLISPFWSCRINENVFLYQNPATGETASGPIQILAKITLDGTDLKGEEILQTDAPIDDYAQERDGSDFDTMPTKDGKWRVVTGADYYHETVDNKPVRKPYNVCDGPTRRIYYRTKSGENFGKAQDYLGAGADCCKYCKSADENGNITFTNNVYCSALDPECEGKSYAVYDDPCPKAGSSSGGDSGGTTNGGIFTSVLTGGLGGGGTSTGGGTYSGGGGLTGGGSPTGGGLTGGGSGGTDGLVGDF